MSIGRARVGQSHRRRRDGTVKGIREHVPL
jgi:hypothetical protein